MPIEVIFIHFCRMMRIGETLISEDLLERYFTCDLEKCKGACCVEGDLGAPLEAEELKPLEHNFKDIEPFLTEEGLEAIKEQGLYILDFEGDYSTPTIGGRECAYAIRDENGILQCGIEVAYTSGVSSIQKPISCHLYPVRISKHTTNIAVNYDKWVICDPACTLGASLNVPLHLFLKEALIRKFGEGWYNQLEIYARERKISG